MKSWLPIVLATAALLGLAGVAFAQDDQEALREKLRQKRDSEFFKAADWTTDYDAALKSAGKSEKLVFAYFTRSYAG